MQKTCSPEKFPGVPLLSSFGNNVPFYVRRICDGFRRRMWRCPALAREAPQNLQRGFNRRVSFSEPNLRVCDFDLLGPIYAVASKNRLKNRRSACSSISAQSRGGPPWTAFSLIGVILSHEFRFWYSCRIFIFPKPNIVARYVRRIITTISPFLI